MSVLTSATATAAAAAARRADERYLICTPTQPVDRTKITDDDKLANLVAYLSRDDVRCMKQVRINDFPCTAAECALLNELLRVYGFQYLILCDPSVDFNSCPMPASMYPWPHLPRDGKTVIPLNDARLVRGARYFPPHIYPREDPRHDAFVPHDIPDRVFLHCIKKSSSNTILKYLALLTPQTHMPINPLSLSREALQHIAGHTLNYFVSPKHDGSRYRLLLSGSSKTGKAYFINRANNVWKRINVPRDATIDGTLLDVECVAPDRQIVVLDAFVVHNECLRDVPSVAARVQRAQSVMDRLSTTEMRLVPQTYQPLREFFASNREDITARNALNDGIIFTPLQSHVRSDVISSFAWKWKPPHQKHDGSVGQWRRRRHPGPTS